MSRNFFLVDDVWVTDFTKKLRSREVAVRVLMDLSANQTTEGDPYLELARDVKRQRGEVIDDPEKAAMAAHKGRSHSLFLENQVPVPKTMIVSRNELENFKITDEIKAELGVPFVVKPGLGRLGGGGDPRGRIRRRPVQIA